MTRDVSRKYGLEYAERYQRVRLLTPAAGLAHRPQARPRFDSHTFARNWASVEIVAVHGGTRHP